MSRLSTAFVAGFRFKPSAVMLSNAVGAGKQRSNIKPGAKVQIVLKADQRTGKLTEGTVGSLLTNSQNHPHGIKVKLQDGRVGRVQKVLSS
ncbi:MAG: hypothetical protein M1831_007371 [Alyxoria varia]|nr:MAG: hypothetical protein M1831_007371 [Alyxoria varia]